MVGLELWIKKYNNKFLSYFKKYVSLRMTKSKVMTVK